MPFFAFDAEDNPMRFETKSALRAERDALVEFAAKACLRLTAADVARQAWEDLAAAHETAVADNDMLLELNASLTDERDNLKREVDHLQRESADLNDKLVSLNETLVQYAAQLQHTQGRLTELDGRNERQYERIQSLELEVDEFDSLQYRAGLLSDACDLADQERLAASNRHGRLGTVTIRELMGWNA